MQLNVQSMHEVTSMSSGVWGVLKYILYVLHKYICIYI